MDTDRPTWRSRSWVAAVGVAAVLGLLVLVAGFDSPSSAQAFAAVAVVAVVAVATWALLRTRAQRLGYEEELAAWAAERAAQAERLRIARDLHDLASHGLGLITLRAASARTVPRPAGDTERAAALADIETVSRQTTTELRRMLAVLRAPGPAPLRPADTMADLPAIVLAAERHGLTTTLELGELGEVTPGVQLTMCAVVREALHNTLRHAGPALACVRVFREGPVVTLHVQDAGPHPGWRPQPGGGHGLDGLRERAGALGGTVLAGPSAPGWLVTAHLPDPGTA